MANRTAKDAKSIKGTNPQYLIEKIIRTRIYDCKYWKEECFGLTAELLVDCAMELDHLGGIYGGNVQPTPFLCLILKMLQIQPNKDIIIEFIKNPDYKYVRALGALYLRLVGETMECYNYLEPLYNDYRKLKRKNRNGEFELIHVDEFIDELLHDERVCDIILPRIQKRYTLEQNEQLEPRVSALDDDLSDDLDSEGEDEEEEEEERSSHRRSPAHRRYSERDKDTRDRDRRHRSRSKSPPSGRRRRSRSPRGQRHSPSHEDRDRRRGRSRSRSHSPRRHHSPSNDDSRSHRRDRKRSRSKSRSPTSSHHHHRDRDSHHRSSKHTSERKTKSSSNKSKEKSKKSEKNSKAGKKMVTSSGKELTAEKAEEIRQANELRAKLGMKPLQL